MQRQLAELDRARKRFIATASHELRTPIFSLGGFLELLEDEELDDETRARFLTQLREQVDRLAKLATDLLDLSRLEAGSLELRPEPTDLGDARPHDVAGEFAPALAAHESHLELRLPDGRRRRPTCDPERRGPDPAHPHRQRPQPHARRAPTSSSPRARRRRPRARSR